MQNPIGIIVVNYNAGSALGECIESLLEHVQSEICVVIVDNGSTDDSLKASVLEKECVRVIINDYNAGYAVACNQAVDFLNTDYFVFVNPDCYFTQPVIEPMRKQLESNKKAAIIGCRVNNINGSEQIGSRRRLPNLWRLMCTYLKLSKLPMLGHFFSGINLIDRPMPETTIPVQAVSGAYFIIKSADFHQLKGFDTRYPLHFEDLDLFKRILDRQRQILLDPCLSVKHHKGLSSVDKKQVLEWKKQGLIIYFEKHHNKFSSTLIKCVAPFIG